MKGALGLEYLSLKRLHGQASGGGGAPSLGTLEDMLRKSLDTGISLHTKRYYYTLRVNKYLQYMQFVCKRQFIKQSFTVCIEQ
jgi:hypothetical protein